jgi:hypothetical protein
MSPLALGRSIILSYRPTIRTPLLSGGFSFIWPVGKPTTQTDRHYTSFWHSIGGQALVSNRSFYRLGYAG